MAMVGDRLVRLRGALKSFGYSGLVRDRWQQPDRVLAALELREGQRVADVGAGGGYFSFRVARSVGPEGRVYAVEPDGDMRDLLRRRAARDGHTNVVPVEPGDDDPGLPEPVDAVLIVNAFHHLPDDRRRYFERLSGMLAPSGRVAIVESRPRWFLFGHATEPDEIRATLAGAGFDLAAEHDYLPRQSFLIFRRAG